jgi:ribonuclease HI
MKGRNKMLKIYCDGATSGNGQANAVGGYAWAILDNAGELLCYDSGHVKNATNNICELLAIINGCEKALSLIEEFDSVIIYSDSAYCINCKNQNWYRNWQNNGWKNSKKQQVANRDLWERLIPFFEDARFTFEKVKGHCSDDSTNSKWNSFVDNLAVEAKKI